MEWAADYAERNKLFEPPKNERGYARDGYKFPTPSEKANIIIELAQTVTEDPAKGSYYLTKISLELKNLAEYLEQAQDPSEDYVSKSAVRAVHDKLVDLWKELERA